MPPGARAKGGYGNGNRGRPCQTTKGLTMEQHQGMDPQAPSLSAACDAAGGSWRIYGGPAATETLGPSDGVDCKGALHAFSEQHEGKLARAMDTGIRKWAAECLRRCRARRGGATQREEEVLGALAATGAVVQRTFPFEACDIYITAKMGGVDVLWLVALQMTIPWPLMPASKQPAADTPVTIQKQRAVMEHSAVWMLWGRQMRAGTAKDLSGCRAITPKRVQLEAGELLSSAGSSSGSSGYVDVSDLPEYDTLEDCVMDSLLPALVEVGPFYRNDWSIDTRFGSIFNKDSHAASAVVHAEAEQVLRAAVGAAQLPAEISISPSEISRRSLLIEPHDDDSLPLVDVKLRHLAVLTGCQVPLSSLADLMAQTAGAVADLGGALGGGAVAPLQQIADILRASATSSYNLGEVDAAINAALRACQTFLLESARATTTARDGSEDQGEGGQAQQQEQPGGGDGGAEAAAGAAAATAVAARCPPADAAAAATQQDQLGGGSGGVGGAAGGGGDSSLAAGVAAMAACHAAVADRHVGGAMFDAAADGRRKARKYGRYMRSPDGWTPMHREVSSSMQQAAEVLVLHTGGDRRLSYAVAGKPQPFGDVGNMLKYFQLVLIMDGEACYLISPAQLALMEGVLSGSKPVELAPSARCNSTADLAARLPQLMLCSNDVQLAAKAIPQLRLLAKLALFVQLDCCGLDLTQGGLQGNLLSRKGSGMTDSAWLQHLVGRAAGVHAIRAQQAVDLFQNISDGGFVQVVQLWLELGRIRTAWVNAGGVGLLSEARTARGLATAALRRGGGDAELGKRMGAVIDRWQRALEDSGVAAVRGVASSSVSNRDATSEQLEAWWGRLVKYWDPGTGGAVSKAFAAALSDDAGVTLKQLASRWRTAHQSGSWRVQPDLAKASAELQQLAEVAAPKIAAKEAAAAAAAAAAEAAAQQPRSRLRSGAERSEAAQGAKRHRAK